MIRQAIENANSEITFKYEGEEWKANYSAEHLEVFVNAGGDNWTSVSNEDMKVRHQKDATKKAKKIIDGMDHQY